MPRLDLGATNFQFNFQSVGVLVYKPGPVEFFGCEHCNHQLTFVEPPEKYNWLGGVVFGGRWLAVEHLA